jgi:hypothetical protein
MRCRRDRCSDLAYRERHDPRHVIGYRALDMIDKAAEEFNSKRPWKDQFSVAELWDAIEAYILKACKERPKSTTIQSIVDEIFANLAVWQEKARVPRAASSARVSAGPTKRRGRSAQLGRL